MKRVFFFEGLYYYIDGVILLNKQLTYYLDGEKQFREGEQIFINRSFEEVESHLHAHNFIEIAYVASGSGIHSIGGKEYAVSKGDLFVINYDIPHEFRSLPGPTESRLIVYNCIFKPEFLELSLVNSRDFSDITNLLIFRSFFPEESEDMADIKLLAMVNREVEDIYEKMYREYKAREAGYIEILRAYVIQLLITIFRLYRKSIQRESAIENGQRQIINKVIHHIKSNYANELKLEDLSMMAFWSRNYFCKLFKEHTGMTVLEYTQKVRIEEACRMLKETDRKVIDIANEVGYRDIKFFNHIFKRITGKTPGNYR